MNATALTRACWQEVTHQATLGPLLPVNVPCHQLPRTALHACDHARVFCVGAGAIVKHQRPVTIAFELLAAGDRGCGVKKIQHEPLVVLLLLGQQLLLLSVLLLLLFLQGLQQVPLLLLLGQQLLLLGQQLLLLSVLLLLLSVLLLLLFLQGLQQVPLLLLLLEDLGKPNCTNCTMQRQTCQVSR